MRCSIALNTVSTRDDSTVEGALLSMLEEWFGVKAGSVREQWRGDVVSRRLFDTHKFTSCLLATRTDDGVVSGNMTLSLTIFKLSLPLYIYLLCLHRVWLISVFLINRRCCVLHGSS